MEISCHPYAHVVKRDAGERHACQGLMKCGKANTTDRTVLRMQGDFLMPTESEGKVMKNNLILSDAIEQLVIENRTTGERIAVITHEDVFTASDNIVVRLKPRAD